MITSSYSLTATERVLPKLALDFTTAILDPRITFTRSGNTATVINSSGVIVGVNADIPRFDYNPTTLVCNGLLIEESRTNVLLNSLLDGTSLAAQAVVVTATARTLSFYGTGEIVLSGAASATVTGTGAYPTRTTLTFTPSAGALTLTVTGTVQFAQLELGVFATSYIPTTASQVTRSADVATMTGTNFSDWYNTSEGTLQAVGTPVAPVASNSGMAIAQIYQESGATRNFIHLSMGSASRPRLLVYLANTLVLNSAAASNQTAPLNQVAALKSGSISFASNAVAIATNSAQNIPTGVTQLGIAYDFYNARGGNAWVSKINYWPMKLTNAETQAFSK